MNTVEGCGLNRIMTDCQAVVDASEVPPMFNTLFRLGADTSCKELSCPFFDATLDESFLAPRSLAESLRLQSDVQIRKDL
jgi:hypothetical protein